MTDHEYAQFAVGLINKAHQNPVELGKLIYAYGTLRTLNSLRGKAQILLDIQEVLDPLMAAMNTTNQVLLETIMADLLTVEKVFGTMELPL